MTQEMRLYDDQGKRLYLTKEERQAFYDAASKAPRVVRTFCHTLFFTGCRISEALALTYGHVDLANKSLVFKTLKKRHKTHHRAIPAPDVLLDSLDMVHGLQEAPSSQKDALLWTWTRQHAWKLVKDVMKEADLPCDQPHATPKGLRHSFGIHAVMSGVPLSELQKLMGHADIRTTAIYLDAVGEEKRALVSRMW